MNVLEMKCLGSEVGVSQMSTVWNDEVLRSLEYNGSWRVEWTREC